MHGDHLSGLRNEEPDTSRGLTLDGPQLLVVDRFAQRGRDRKTVQVDAEHGLAELGVVAPSQARRELHDIRTPLTDDDLRALKVPALVLWTTKDPSGPVDEAKRIADLIPNAQLAVMDNCGHWPQYEDTETFDKIHLDFLLDR